MDAGLGLGDLAATTQIYPTYGQVIRELAGQFQTTRLERGFMATASGSFTASSPALMPSTEPLPARRRSQWIG